MTRILITGGAGFIGSNLVEHWLSKGDHVTVFDNLSRPGGGAKRNIERLMMSHQGNPRFEFVQEDIGSVSQLEEAMRSVDVVLHVAAQTAMTTSIHDPRGDFDTNARGTFNVLEAARHCDPSPIVVYTSTNKVYGDLTRRPVRLDEQARRWDFADEALLEGVAEDYPLDFGGPYGCSKGIGDAYCVDYARTFGLRTVVFRMSGIYGTGQYATEDQGWIAWFIHRAIEKQPVTIFGDGKQVRDILYISDLLKAFDRAVDNIDSVAGHAFNIGGGRANSISVLELLDYLQDGLGISPSEVNYGPWRLADQKVYISNTEEAKKRLGWEPEVSKEEGISLLHEWIGKQT